MGGPSSALSPVQLHLEMGGAAVGPMGYASLGKIQDVPLKEGALPFQGPLFPRMLFTEVSLAAAKIFQQGKKLSAVDKRELLPGPFSFSMS